MNRPAKLIVSDESSSTAENNQRGKNSRVGRTEQGEREMLFPFPERGCQIFYDNLKNYALGK